MALPTCSAPHCRHPAHILWRGVTALCIYHFEQREQQEAPPRMHPRGPQEQRR
jgi:hypothetical protein